MLFNTLWTILLGVIGGVVSSLIVSRVFLIQNEYQIQIKFVEGIIQKMSHISVFLQSAKAILEVSYDQDIKMKKEMREKGYNSEKEYYVANADKDWIYKDDALKVFHREINMTMKTINKDLQSNPVEDAQLNKLIRDIITYVHDVSSTKDFTFSQIGQFEKIENSILKQYEACLHMSRKKLFSLVVKDKIMIIMFFIVGILVIWTWICFNLGL